MEAWYTEDRCRLETCDGWSGGRSCKSSGSHACMQHYLAPTGHEAVGQSHLRPNRASISRSTYVPPRVAFAAGGESGYNWRPSAHGEQAPRWAPKYSMSITKRKGGKNYIRFRPVSWKVGFPATECESESILQASKIKEARKNERK